MNSIEKVTNKAAVQTPAEETVNVFYNEETGKIGAVDENRNDVLFPSSPTKVFRAVINQTGTAAPVITNIIENTFGSTPIFSRTGAGEYGINLVGIVEGKTIFRGSAEKALFAGGSPSTINTLHFIEYGLNGNDNVFIKTWNGDKNSLAWGDAQDNVLDGVSTYIEIITLP